MLEEIAWFNNSTGTTTLIVEPNFEEVLPLTIEDDCDYCGRSEGFPYVEGIYVFLFCDECTTLRLDDIRHEIASI